ncbi:hypothetical protein [uncultured Planococcus sp.]|uniref:hypothetical protein n=1 Tax=uncultured Planococcus sp. TaxID=337815 RepID=UPI002613ECB3|nr:hypothetical protein [uncultured Planococcus sp.]
MIIVERQITIDEDEMRAGLTLEIDGKMMFNVRDGESEDRLLFRDFHDCYAIKELLKYAYEAGKAGEEFEIEVIKEVEDV